MPGCSRTSSSACLPRVPEPRGRPRRRVPAAARWRDAAACVRRDGGVAGAARRRAPRRGLEAVVLVDVRAQLVHAAPRSHVSSLRGSQPCPVLSVMCNIALHLPVSDCVTQAVSSDGRPRSVALSAASDAFGLVRRACRRISGLCGDRAQRARTVCGTRCGSRSACRRRRRREAVLDDRPCDGPGPCPPTVRRAAARLPGASTPL